MPINVLLIAAHHTSGNVASFRSRAMASYLDETVFRVTTLTREAPAESEVLSEPGVIPLPGRTSGGGPVVNVARDLLRVLWISLLNVEPQSQPERTREATWLENVVREGIDHCRAAQARGEECVVVATYSPLEALVAARIIAHRTGAPFVLDFRDGLAFETLGRQGRAAAQVRRLLESVLIAKVDLVTTVSEPLVRDFRSRYPKSAVELLPNGYEPTQVQVSEEWSRSAEAFLSRHGLEGKRLVGHFGRVGGSDFSSTDTLAWFVAEANRNNLGEGWHALFVGELTLQERALLSKLELPCTVLDPVERELAWGLMSTCDRLLLLTGTRVSSATGKLFDYLASGTEILCVTAVENEAARIIRETAAGSVVVTSGSSSSLSEAWDSIATGGVTAGGGREAVQAYDRSRQMQLFGESLKRIVAVGT